MLGIIATIVHAQPVIRTHPQSWGCKKPQKLQRVVVLLVASVEGHAYQFEQRSTDIIGWHSYCSE